MESITVFRQNAAQLIAKKLSAAAGEKCVFLCIGASGVVSDSLGPKVGSILNESQTRPLVVYGDGGGNVNAVNVSLAEKFVRAMHPDKKIVVVDAAVGDSTEVGCVVVKQGGVCPGAATDKKLPQVGDVSVLGVVSMRGAENFYRSHADRVSLVDKMAQTIAEAIMITA